MRDLSTRQIAVFRFIRDCLVEGSGSPTLEEIRAKFRFRSVNSVSCHVRALEQKGWLERSPLRSRGLSLSAEALERERGLIWSGVVSAGVLREAVEQHERIDLGAMFNSREHFVLTVEGDSMIEEHIADGDYIVVHRQRTAKAGQIAVVRTEDGEATLKYWFPERGRIRLQPANRRLSPIYVRHAEVLGVVKAVIRRTG